jgi:isoquinoline 1-oxidoreductase beta subunit
MKTTTLDRSTFIRLTSALGAGLGLSFRFPASAAEAPSGSAGEFVPNAWVRIAPDESVTIIVAKSEMGQGVATGLPTILADELDASMDHVRIEFAPADPRYIDPLYGDMITGGSTSVAHLWTPLRQAGATARAMLVTAASQQWQVDPSTCTTREGVVYHAASQRSATYGSLAAAASAIAPPAKVPLKTPGQFTLIGKPRKRIDIPLKVNGTAKYGIDVRVPGMLYAAIARSPVFGGKVKHFDGKKARAVHGVTDVVQVSNGVAVVAKNTWAAFKGKDALAIVWDEGPNAQMSTASLFAEAEHLGRTGKNERVAVTRGNPDSNDGTVLYATYRGPFIAHATMEPMNATADVRDDSCVVWAPNQVQLRAQKAAADASGLPLAKCTIHTTYLGGGFGRRLEADYVSEAVEVSKAIKAPVKVMWTREDDTQHDYYRPMSLNVVRGVVSKGELTALAHQIVSPSWLQRWWPAVYQGGIDPLDLLGVIDAPYTIPNFRVSYINHEQGVPVGSFRAPDANWNAFVTESFLDELAHAAHQDPVAFRLGLMKANPRAAAVLTMAAEKAGWGHKRPAHIAQGIAISNWAGSYAAMIADVSMEGKMPRVHRVVAVVDCGTVVNPDIVMQQIQGATNYGLSAALTGKITIKNGRVEQSNFYDYTVLHMSEAPQIEGHVIASTETPTGIGEICTPTIGPAVGNAIFTLTGKRVRSLPFSDALA